MSIRMPNEKEKRNAMQYIIREGLPQKKNLSCLIADLVQTIGFRNLFWGTWDCVFLALIGGIVIGILFVTPSAIHYQLFPISLFFAAPAVYELLHSLTMWKERQIGLYEMKMTCRYTLKDLTALRMVFFGGISALLDVLLVLCLQQQLEVILSFFQMIGISLSALFLYGSATLFTLCHGRRRQFAVPVIWNTLCIAPVILEVDLLEIFIKIPGIVALIVAFASMMLFLLQLKRYLSIGNKGGLDYVVG